MPACTIASSHPYKVFTQKKSLCRLPSCKGFSAWARGFEPPTFWSVAKRSIQLSYAHILYTLLISNVYNINASSLFCQYACHTFLVIRFYLSNTVCSSTGVIRAFNPLSTSSLLIFLLLSSPRFGFPSGYGIPTAGTILFAPIVSEIGTTVAICTTGMPARSISFTIVAPQRVQVPHVEVRMTAPIWSSSSFLTKSLPNPLAFPVDVPVPVVVMK